jgi:uncharacterized damage-inducible protein DinB
MTVKDLERLFDYSYWANARLFGVIVGLSADEFTQPVAGSYGSVRNTLVHMLSAEAGWLDRSGGSKRGPKLVADDFPTAESLVQAWTTVESKMRTFLAGLRDEDLDRDIEFELESFGRRSMKLGDLLYHAANHGVHHRGQIALLLGLLGRTPGNVDLLIYFAELRRDAAA